MLTDELAYLIDKEQQTEVTIILCLNVFLHFSSERFYGHIDIIVDNLRPDDICCQCWVNFFCHLESQIKSSGCKTGYVSFPIIAFVLDVFLELLELSVIIQSFLQILSHSKIEGVVTASSIKLVPENSSESCSLIGIGIVYVTNVKQNHFDISLIHIPVLECLDFT